MAKTPHWLTRAFSLVERDDLTVNLDQLTTLQKVGVTARRGNMPRFPAAILSSRYIWLLRSLQRQPPP